jgi:NAD(P)-dependent dehydrogenase (short-subunit alcohol dehydrogenase family)
VIINVTSSGSLMPLPGIVPYGAAKAALNSMSRSLAAEYGPKVRVNTLSPGGLFANQDPQFLAKYCGRVPLGRMAEPDDLSGPLVFLASDASRYVTGATIYADGGYMQHLVRYRSEP